MYDVRLGDGMTAEREGNRDRANASVDDEQPLKKA